MREKKPVVLKVNYHDVDSLCKSFVTSFRNGGFFYPTRQVSKFQLGDEVFVIAKFPSVIRESTVKTNVAWLTPETCVDLKKGVGLEFLGSDGEELKKKILDTFGDEILNANNRYIM